MVCVVMFDSYGIGLRDVDLQADKACQHDKRVRLCLHISEFMTEEVLQMSGKAPYNTSFTQGQLAHDVVQDNGEEKRRSGHPCLAPTFVLNEPLILPLRCTASSEFK